MGTVQPTEDPNRDCSNRHSLSGPFGLDFDPFTAVQKNHIKIKDLPHSL